ncbi:MAG TPA: SDR family oxidoreductase [Pirellulales bacterium]
MKLLQGRAAIVTGASQGIGLGAGIALAEAGAEVAFNYREPKGQAEGAVEKINSTGGRAILVRGDVARHQDVERMVAETVSAFGRLDIAVSNAAYSDREPFYSADLDGFRRTVDVTMWGAFHLLHAATRQMMAQAAAGNPPGGSIVIVSSPHAYVAIPRSMAYNMSKAAIDQMARTAAIELTEHRIRVNVITPGWIDTPGERKFASDETIARSGEKLPWKRLGTPAEIGRGIVFLCDPASDYITGSSLLIDGGITLPWWANRGSGVPE